MGINPKLLSYDKQSNMSSIDIQSLIASRLEDMADQVEYLYSKGNFHDAELIHAESLDLAGSFDAGTTFLFINDLTEAA